jgi:hypothetical protein
MRFMLTLDSGCRQVRVCPMASGCGLPHDRLHYSLELRNARAKCRGPS